MQCILVCLGAAHSFHASIHFLNRLYYRAIGLQLIPAVNGQNNHSHSHHMAYLKSTTNPTCAALCVFFFSELISIHFSSILTQVFESIFLGTLHDNTLRIPTTYKDGQWSSGQRNDERRTSKQRVDDSSNALANNGLLNICTHLKVFVKDV